MMLVAKSTAQKDSIMLKVSTPKFKKTIAHLEKLDEITFRQILEEYGAKGVSALSSATPQDTGETASSWTYRIEGSERTGYKLIWSNSVMAGSAPLVILLQYGHGTRNGGYVSGRDFINPALESVYDGLRERLVREVVS